MSNVKITERGWGGHFICAARCSFRRNTLVEGSGDRIVVSTVGNMREPDTGKIQSIGAGVHDLRYYETMIFDAEQDGPYVDAASNKRRSDYKGRCGIYVKSPDKLPGDVDNVANDMHEAAVAFYVELLGKE